MKRNLGGKDQTVRFMIASAGITMGLFAKRGWIRAVGFGVGGAELATAISRHSLLNKALHRNTAPPLSRVA
jgi:Inner membrane protein YgaP-like, transmembrane domain